MRKKKGIYILMLFVIAGFILNDNLRRPTSQAREPAEQGRGLLARVKELENKLSRLTLTNPPVGTVLPFAGDWPPFKDRQKNKRWTEKELGWLLCDGRTINAAEYPALVTVLGNKKLPNFVGKVARGKLKSDTLGIAKGRDEIPATRTGSEGSHRHALPSLTGGVAIISPTLQNRLENQRYTTRDDNRRWGTNVPNSRNSTHIRVDGGDNNEGQHIHALGGVTTKSGDHSHTIPKMTIVPSYLPVHYIIKAEAR